MLLNILFVAGATCATLPAVDAELKTVNLEQIATMADAEPACWQANVLLGRARLADGDIDHAIARFETAERQQSDDSTVHTWLGRALLSRAGERNSLDDAEKGVEHLEKAIALDPENLDARQTLAAFHRVAPWIAGGDMDIADEQAEFIRERDPLRGLLMLAQNRMADGDEDEAIAMLRDALDEHPGWTDAALQLGLFYHDEERFDEAFAILNRFASQDGANPMFVYQLGRTAALSGRFLDEGREAMRRYVALAEEDDTLAVPPSPAWWRLGMIEEHAGNVDEARAAYAKALDHDPGNEKARRALNALQ